MHIIYLILFYKQYNVNTILALSCLDLIWSMYLSEYEIENHLPYRNIICSGSLLNSVNNLHNTIIKQGHLTWIKQFKLLNQIS